MLVYSYQVEVKKLQATIKGLELDLLHNPNNERAKKKLNEARDELSWFEERIREGKDPGMRIE